LSWPDRGKEPFPLLICAGDRITVEITPPDLVKGSVKLRLNVDRLHFGAFRDGHPATLRLAPAVIVQNDHVAELVIPSLDLGTKEAAVFSRLEVVDSAGVTCATSPVDAKDVQVDIGSIVPPGDKRLFPLAHEYDIVVPTPGKYRVVVAIGMVQKGGPMMHPFFLSSEPFEIEVQAAGAAPAPSS